MTDELKKLLREARNRIMSDEDRWRQRCSFAYGNAAIGNPNVTREMVAEISLDPDHVDRGLSD